MMYKRIVSIFVCLIMVLSIISILPPAAARTGGAPAQIAGITFYQVDYYWTNGKSLNSDTGMIEIDIPTLKLATRLDSGYVNGFTSQGWIIRNLPFQEDYPYLKKSTYFDLGQTGDVRALNIYIEATPNFRARFYSGAMTTYTVYNTINKIEGGEDPLQNPIFNAPDLSALQFNPVLFDLTYTQPNHNYPDQNVQTAVAQCVPAGYANSLQYLEDTFGVNIPDDNKMGIGNCTLGWINPSDSLVANLDCHMYRFNVQSRLVGSGTGTNGSIKGILNYTGINNIPIEVKHQGVRGDIDFTRAGKTSIGMGDVFWPWVVNEVKLGHAVTLRYWRFANGLHYGGHQIAVVTAGWIGGVPYVEFCHDSQQSNDLFGCVIQTSFLGINATDGNYTLLGVTETVDGPVEIVRAVSMDPVNQPPNQPDIPIGEIYLHPNTMYEYRTSTTDPEGNDIYFQFHWIDSTYSEWVGPYISGQLGGDSHSWDFGYYGISVRARDQFYAHSDWSSTLLISVGIYDLNTEIDICLDQDLPMAKTGDKKIDDEIDKVIGHLRKSLDDKFWLDSLHLDPQFGHRVFSEHKAAVQKLQELPVHKNIPDSVQDTCWEVMNKLALTDGQLAKVIIEETQAPRRTNNQATHQLTMAEQEFNEGLNQYVQGEPDKAIDNYRQAWEHAQKVIN